MCSLGLPRLRSRQRHRLTQLLVALHGDRCYYCTRTFEGTGRRQRTLDHRLPLSRGGTHALVNLVLSCQRCNCAKGDLTWLEYMQTATFRKKRYWVEYDREHPPRFKPTVEVVTSLEVAA